MFNLHQAKRLIWNPNWNSLHLLHLQHPHLTNIKRRKRIRKKRNIKIRRNTRNLGELPALLNMLKRNLFYRNKLFLVNQSLDQRTRDIGISSSIYTKQALSSERIKHWILNSNWSQTITNRLWFGKLRFWRHLLWTVKKGSTFKIVIQYYLCNHKMNQIKNKWMF